MTTDRAVRGENPVSQNLLKGWAREGVRPPPGRRSSHAPAILRSVIEEDDVADRAAAIRQAKFNIGIAERLRFLGERRNGFSRRWCRARDRNRSNRSRWGCCGRFRDGQRGGRCHSLHSRRRCVLGVVNLQANERDDAKGNGNPCLSIHKNWPRGYSQTQRFECGSGLCAATIEASRPLPLLGGTGSCPRPPHGLQRARRQTPSQLPRITPCVSSASKK